MKILSTSPLLDTPSTTTQGTDNASSTVFAQTLQAAKKESKDTLAKDTSSSNPASSTPSRVPSHASEPKNAEASDTAATTPSTEATETNSPLPEEVHVFKRKVQRQLESLGALIGNHLGQSLKGVGALGNPPGLPPLGLPDALSHKTIGTVFSDLFVPPSHALRSLDTAEESLHGEPPLPPLVPEVVSDSALSTLDSPREEETNVASEAPLVSAQTLIQSLLNSPQSSANTANPVSVESTSNGAAFAGSPMSTHTPFVTANKNTPENPKETKESPTLEKPLSSELTQNSTTMPPPLPFGLTNALSKGANPQALALRSTEMPPSLPVEFSSQLSGLVTQVNEPSNMMSAQSFIQSLQELKEVYQAHLSVQQMQSLSSVTLDVQLPSLGKTALQVSWNAQEGSARIHFETQNAKDLAILEGALEHLAQSLERNGITVEQITASERTDPPTHNASSGFSFEQNPQHQRGHFLLQHQASSFAESTTEPSEEPLVASLSSNGFEVSI